MERKKATAPKWPSKGSSSKDFYTEIFSQSTYARTPLSPQYYMFCSRFSLSLNFNGFAVHTFDRDGQNGLYILVVV